MLRRFTITALPFLFIFNFLTFNLFFTVNVQQATAQSDKQRTIDSLQRVIADSPHDTTKVEALNKLAMLIRYNSPDTAIKLSRKALKLAKKLSSSADKAVSKSMQKSVALSHDYLGILHQDRGHYNVALNHYKKALKIHKKLNNKRNISITLGNIGIIYKNQGNYPKALEYHLQSLKIKRQIGNKKSIAITLGNIGLIYDKQGNYSKALDYYFKSLEIKRQIKSKRGIAISLSNIGIVYKKEGDYLKALKYYYKALEKSRQLKAKRLRARTLINIAELYTALYQKPDSVRRPVMKAVFPDLSVGNLEQSLPEHSYFLLLDTALTLQKKSVRIYKERGDKKGLIQSYKSFGHILQAKKRYQKARRYYHRGYKLADSIGLLELQKTIAYRLYAVYQKLHQPGRALKWHERYATHKDSLFNKQKQKEVGRLETRHKWQKKQMKDSLQHAKELRAQQLKHQHEIQQQRYVLYSAGGGLLLVLVFAAILYNRFRLTQRQRDLIEQQKEEVDAKNREITASINYAKRIQEALLKEEEYVTPDLPSYFVLLKPQATVSGDFYWSVKKGEEWYVAVADCTGHGVPGGFLTMLGSAFLNEITTLSGQIAPAEILNQLRDRFIKELGEGGTQRGDKFRMRDGMDISLLRLNLKSNKAQWAGAKNPLYIVRNKNKPNVKGQKIKKVDSKDYKLFELSPNKQPISYVQDPEPFTNREIKLQKNDSLYLFSDGYPDQFGGPKGKKFMYKRFKHTLIDLQGKEMTAQKQYLEDIIEEWMAQNDEEQIDDICVLGIKVS